VVITISNQYGSGAVAVGHAAAERLGYVYVDEQLPIVVARRLHTTAAAVDSAENSGESMSERMLRALGSGTPEVGGSQAAASDFDSQCLREVQEAVREFAAAGNAVIIGRGANAILGRRSDVLRVFLHAPKEWRIAHIAQVHNVDPRVAAAEVNRIDRARADYMRENYRIEWGNPDNYDLSLDTARLGAEVCAGIVVAAASGR